MHSMKEFAVCVMLSAGCWYDYTEYFVEVMVEHGIVQLGDKGRGYSGCVHCVHEARGLYHLSDGLSRKFDL